MMNADETAMTVRSLLKKLFIGDTEAYFSENAEKVKLRRGPGGRWYNPRPGKDGPR